MPNTRIFEPVNEQIVDDIKRELRLQGHYLTGALEASLNGKEVSESGGVTLTAEALAYLEHLEKGIPADRIEIDSKTLAEMTRYVELRMGYRGSKALAVAHLILRKQQREGNPTRGSYKYSSTGERKKAVEETFDRNQDRYINGIDNAAIGSIDHVFHEIKSGTV